MFQGAHEHFVESERVGPVFGDDSVRVDDITTALGHLLPVIAQDHSLIHKPLEWLRRGQVTQVKQDFVPESGVEQMEHRMLRAADIKINPSRPRVAAHPILLDLLADDGIMLTHTIGRTSGPGGTDAWTRKHVFPGGYIPALSELVVACEQTGWQAADVEVLRYHYAFTLHEWYRRTTAHRDEIVRLYDERLFRMWQFYLAGAEQSFSCGGNVNYHLQTVKRQAVLPLTRDYIADETRRLIDSEPAPEWHLSRDAAE